MSFEGGREVFHGGKPQVITDVGDGFIRGKQGLHRIGHTGFCFFLGKAFSEEGL